MRLWVLFLVALILDGCMGEMALKSQERSVERQNQELALYSGAKEACFAVEFAESEDQGRALKRRCVMAKYDFCVEAYKNRRLIWYSEYTHMPRRDKEGRPVKLYDMNSEMRLNKCDLRF